MVTPTPASPTPPGSHPTIRLVPPDSSSSLDRQGGRDTATERLLAEVKNAYDLPPFVGKEGHPVIDAVAAYLETAQKYRALHKDLIKALNAANFRRSAVLARSLAGAYYQLVAGLEQGFESDAARDALVARIKNLHLAEQDNTRCAICGAEMQETYRRDDLGAFEGHSCATPGCGYETVEYISDKERETERREEDAIERDQQRRALVRQHYGDAATPT